MELLLSLIVDDFQSHKSTEIEFVPGVNIICGMSQSGKTALFRALNLVVNNRPSGDRFVRHGAEVAVVSVIGKANNQVFSVTRSKGEKKNTYEVVVGAEEADFKAFGASVPEKISELFNLTDVNVQDQLSPYFLVLDTPGYISQYIRNIAKFDDIDEVVSLLAGKIRTKTGLVSDKEVLLKSEKSSLSLLLEIDLDTIESNIKIYEGLKLKDSGLSIEIQDLSFLINSLSRVEDDFDDVNKIDIALLEQKCLECSSLQSSEVRLRCTIDDLTGIVKGLESIEEIDISVPEDIFERKDELASDCMLLTIECGDLEELIVCISSANICIENTDVMLESNENERIELLGLITECPSCGQDLDEVAKDLLLERSCLDGL